MIQIVQTLKTRLLKKNFFLSIITIVIITVFVIVVILDCTYWEYISCNWASEAIILFKKLKPKSITYSGGLTILKSSVGMLMTIISLFLNTNIDIIQRRELNAYGILRSELIVSNNHIIYMFLDKWNYISPLLMLAFINISFSLSGYLVFIYSYIVLVVRYSVYANSFNKNSDRQHVIRKLVECIECFDVQNKYIWEYQMLVEQIGRNAKKEGNWKEIEILFKELMDKVRVMSDSKKYLAVMNFYQYVYLKDKDCEKVAIQFIKKYIEDMEKCVSRNQILLTQEWSIIWGLFKVLFNMAQEESLIDFLSWILDSKTRSKIITNELEMLSELVLDAEYEMCLIGLEDSLSKRGISKHEFAEQLKLLWKLGEKTYLLDNNQQYGEKIYLLSYELKEKDAPEIENVRHNLSNDYIKGSNKTYIANVIQI